MKTLKPAFQLDSVRIPIHDLKETAPRKNFRTLSSYHVIVASIREMGIIQPIVVCPSINPGKYKILDGHLRVCALRELEQKYVYCIISTDDERYTFDAQINNLSTFQRANMIAKAVESGISLSKISLALGINENQLRSDMDVTEGLDQKVVDILKTVNVSKKALIALRKVKSVRQIEIAWRMVNMKKFSYSFVQSMIDSTADCLFVDQKKPKRTKDIDLNEIASMESEIKNLEANAREASEKYERQFYELSIVISFIGRLFSHKRIDEYIKQKFPETYEKFKQISAMKGIADWTAPDE